MSAPLVSPGLIKKMRKIANRGLQTPVMLLRRLPVVANPYGDDTEDWVTLGEYMGWMRSVNTARIEDTTGNVAGTIGVYRLHLVAEVRLFPGDLVVFDSNEYTVQDDNYENTYKVFTTATIRRRD